MERDRWCSLTFWSRVFSPTKLKGACCAFIDGLLLLMSYLDVYSSCRRFHLGKFVAGQNAKKICYLLTLSGQANVLGLQRISDGCIFIDERLPDGLYTTINVQPSQLFSPALRNILHGAYKYDWVFFRRFWSSWSLFGWPCWSSYPSGSWN